MTENLKNWLALSLVRDIGPVTIKKLLSVFHSPERVFSASAAELREVEGVGEARARGILEFDSWFLAEREIAAARDKGIRIISYADADYPRCLREMEDSPVVLYSKGSFVPEDRYAVAIVGSRRMTDYGRVMTEKIASGLASAGITVVSGMARGIDTVAHRTALRTGGRSIAVLGCGVDNPYPPENRRLAEDISGSGCVISEFPLGTPPNRENFPRRNRLISGLSLGVVVTEATRDSGSLITARYALEQGREVFAVPGNITSRSSDGTNDLIRRGARLIQRPEDIIEELSPVLKGYLREGRKDPDGSPPGLEFTDEEKAICTALGQEPKHVDLIKRETGMPLPTLLGLLLDMEIRGIIRQAEGKRFYLA